MHTTVFKFEEGSPFVNAKRPVCNEIQDRLLWQAIRLSKAKERVFKDGLVIYTPIPAYLDGPTTLEVYWDYENPAKHDSIPPSTC